MHSKPNQVHQVGSTLCWKIEQVLFCLFCLKDYSMLHACFSFSVSGSNGKGYPRSKPRWSCVQRCAEYSHPNYWHWASKDLNLCCEGSDETSSDVFCKEMIVDTSRTKQHAKMSVKSVNVRRVTWVQVLHLARTLRNQDVLLKFWVGISIQIFALCQVLEEPLLGWIPHAIFGNWLSRIWGVLSVYFYVKWLLQIKKWNEAYETKSDKTVARIFHPLMAPAMGSVVVMEVVTFARASDS